MEDSKSAFTKWLSVLLVAAVVAVAMAMVKARAGDVGGTTSQASTK